MHRILSTRVWLMEEGYLNRMAALISERLMRGHDLEGLIKKQTLADVLPRLNALLSVPATEAHGGEASLSDTLVMESSGLVTNGSQRVQLIPIIGPLTKYGDLCSTGMQDYQAMIAAANANPDVDAMVLILDSPGGDVDGTPELALAVKNSQKPVAVFGDGTVASAALWIASQAAYVVANKNNPTGFGSIGALAIDQDFTNLMEANRVEKLRVIRAPQSTEKALMNPFETLSPEAEAQLKEELRSIVSDFIGVVKEGRGDKLDTKTEGLFKGRMFDAYASKQAGLVDSVGTLSTAVNKAASLAKERKKYMNNSGSNAHADTMSKPSWFASLFGWSEEKAAGLTEEQANEEGKKEIASLRASLKAAEDKKAALEARISTLEAEKTTLATERDHLNTQLTELKEKTPTGNATTIISDETREAAMAGDKNKQTVRTPADQEADRLVAVANAQLPKKFELKTTPEE